MFDRTVIAPTRTEHVTTDVNVTIKRAPTDESVKLLKEMEDAARQKVLAGIRIDDNELKAVVHVQKECASFDIHFICILSLNGRREEIKVVVPEHDYTPMLAATKLREAVAERIADRTLEMVFRSMNMRSLGGR